jgi:hypothetical protein
MKVREPPSLIQRVPGSSPGAPTNKINKLKDGQALDLPKMQRWEEHGKMHRPMKIIDAASERPALFDPHHSEHP